MEDHKSAKWVQKWSDHLKTDDGLKRWWVKTVFFFDLVKSDGLKGWSNQALADLV